MSVQGCLDDGNEDGTVDKEDVMEFSLKVLQTFFDDDRETFSSYLADEVYTMEGEGPFSVEEVKDWFDTEDHLINQQFSEYSMEEYLNIYEPVIMDRKEVDSEYPGLTEMLRNLSWDYDDDDYMFGGWDTKNGEEGPLWDDPLAFIVSNESGELKFKAFSS